MNKIKSILKAIWLNVKLPLFIFAAGWVFCLGIGAGLSYSNIINSMLNGKAIVIYSVDLSGDAD